MSDGDYEVLGRPFEALHDHLDKSAMLKQEESGGIATRSNLSSENCTFLTSLALDEMEKPPISTNIPLIKAEIDSCSVIGNENESLHINIVSVAYEAPPDVFTHAEDKLSGESIGVELVKASPIQELREKVPRYRRKKCLPLRTIGDCESSCEIVMTRTMRARSLGSSYGSLPIVGGNVSLPIVEDDKDASSGVKDGELDQLSDLVSLKFDAENDSQKQNEDKTTTSIKEKKKKAKGNLSQNRRHSMPVPSSVTDTPAATDDEDESLRAKYIICELIWAKTANFPWWPCMISYDPLLGIYTKVVKKKSSTARYYHVQYFGRRVLRGWVPASGTIPYEGIQAFKDLCLAAASAKKAKDAKFALPKKSSLAEWAESVADADNASKLSRQERLRKCTFEYKVIMDVKQKRKSSIGTPDKNKDVKRKRNNSSGTPDKSKDVKRKRNSSIVGASNDVKRMKNDSLASNEISESLPDSEGAENKANNESESNEVCSISEGSSADVKSPRKKKVRKSVNAGIGTKTENVCSVCEQVDIGLMLCTGPCNLAFHPMCLGLATVPSGSFTCDECTSGRHTCFSCKSSCGEVVRACTVAHCGRFFHAACIQNSPLAKVSATKLHCPLHACATCAIDNDRKLSAAKGRVLQCIRCPTAYHPANFCLAAGATELDGTNFIVCDKHFVSRTPAQQHINVNWCFMCSAGGTLLCCDSCPAAFHTTCLNIETPDAGTAWECADCMKGQRPLYGAIVWSKLGNFRWWPAEICHPDSVPDFVLEKDHTMGEFPIQFFGSYDYCWTNRGRVYLFEEGDRGSRVGCSKKLNDAFSTAVREANAAIQVYKTERESRNENAKVKLQPHGYRRIQVSMLMGVPPAPKPSLDELPRCNCTPSQNCGPDSDCINRMLMYECHPAVCPAGPECHNRRFQLRQYQPAVPFRTGDREWGLKATADIKAGEFVVEYIGELIDDEECRKRIRIANEKNVQSFYMLTIEKNRIIDAGPRGNLSRFMNHSCQPNCVTQKWNVNGDVRVGIFSIVDIPAGTELTFNYNLDCLGNGKTICKCGAPLCSGFLGVAPKANGKSLDKSKDKKKRGSKRKSKPISFREKHEEECFRCGVGGTLVMCDQAGCPKAYHIACLNLPKNPSGKWSCPWHHCDECGRPATKLCSQCDNSFCNQHGTSENISLLDSALLVCNNHVVDEPDK